MKYLITFLLAVVCIISLNLFLPKHDITVPELVIRPYVVREGVELPKRGDPPEPNKSKFYAYETLELGIPRRLAPVIGADIFNLGFFFDFEGGVIEIISEDKAIQLSTADSDEPWNDEISTADRKFAFQLRVPDGGYMSANPVSSGFGTIYRNDKTVDWFADTGYTGREFYLTVKAYEFSDEKSPVIIAQLKLVQLEEPMPSIGKPNGSRFYSIELISYEMSETYAMELAS